MFSFLDQSHILQKLQEARKQRLQAMAPNDPNRPALEELIQLDTNFNTGKVSRAPIGSNNFFSIYVFSSNPNQTTGYTVEWTNRNRDYLPPPHLPAGFYSFLQTKAGNFVAMRTHLFGSAHPIMLDRIGLDKTQPNVRLGGEIFVDPRGMILFFGPRSGTYHDYSIKDPRQLLTHIGLPAAVYISDINLFERSDFLKKIAASYYQKNGDWHSEVEKFVRDHKIQCSSDALTKLAALQIPNVFFKTDRFQYLDPLGQLFLENLITQYSHQMQSHSTKTAAAVAIMPAVGTAVAPAPVAAALIGVKEAPPQQKSLPKVSVIPLATEDTVVPEHEPTPDSPSGKFAKLL